VNEFIEIGISVSERKLGSGEGPGQVDLYDMSSPDLYETWISRKQVLIRNNQERNHWQWIGKVPIYYYLTYINKKEECTFSSVKAVALLNRFSCWDGLPLLKKSVIKNLAL
jgi:hypothetical protein